MQEEKIILINADLSSGDSPIDARTSAPIRFKRGDTIIIDALLTNNGRPINVETFRNATLEILDVGAYNAPAPRNVNLLMWRRETEIKEVEADAEGNIPEGSKHLRFVFGKEESAIASGEKWMRLYADFEGAKRITFASGWIYVDENFGCEESLMPIESPEFIGRSEMEETYYSKTEIDEIYAQIENSRDSVMEIKTELETSRAALWEMQENSTASANAAETCATKAEAASKAADSSAENAKDYAAASLESANISAASSNASEASKISAVAAAENASASAQSASAKAAEVIQVVDTQLSEINCATSNVISEIESVKESAINELVSLPVPESIQASLSLKEDSAATLFYSQTADALSSASTPTAISVSYPSTVCATLNYKFFRTSASDGIIWSLCVSPERRLSLGYVSASKKIVMHSAFEGVTRTKSFAVQGGFELKKTIP